MTSHTTTAFQTPRSLRSLPLATAVSTDQENFATPMFPQSDISRNALPFIAHRPRVTDKAKLQELVKCAPRLPSTLIDDGSASARPLLLPIGLKKRAASRKSRLGMKVQLPPAQHAQAPLCKPPAAPQAQSTMPLPPVVPLSSSSSTTAPAATTSSLLQPPMCFASPIMLPDIPGFDTASPGCCTQFPASGRGIRSRPSLKMRPSKKEGTTALLL